MYLADIQAVADDEIVERFKGGFVARFMRNCHCITGPYSRLITRKVVTQDVTKLCIQFSDRYVRPGEDDPLATLDIRWPFDFASFVTADNLSKKSAILEAVHAATMHAAERLGWDTRPLISARQALIDANLDWTDVSKKQWVCPNRKIKARIGVHLDLDEFQLFLIIYVNRTEQELGRIPIRTKTPVDNWDYLYLRKAQWRSPTLFEIDVAGTFTFVVEVPNLL